MDQAGEGIFGIIVCLDPFELALIHGDTHESILVPKELIPETDPLQLGDTIYVNWFPQTRKINAIQKSTPIISVNLANGELEILDKIILPSIDDIFELKEKDSDLEIANLAFGHTLGEILISQDFGLIFDAFLDSLPEDQKNQPTILEQWIKWKPDLKKFYVGASPIQVLEEPEATLFDEMYQRSVWGRLLMADRTLVTIDPSEGLENLQITEPLFLTRDSSNSESNNEEELEQIQPQGHIVCSVVTLDPQESTSENPDDKIPNLLVFEDGFKFSSRYNPWRLRQEKSYGPALPSDHPEGSLLAVYLGIYDEAHFFYNERQLFAIIPLEKFTFETYKCHSSDLIPGRKCRVETRIHKRQNGPNKNSFVERIVAAPIVLYDEYYKARIMTAKETKFIMLEVKLGHYVDTNVIKNKGIAIHEEVIETRKKETSRKIHAKVHDWHNIVTKKGVDGQEFTAYIYLEKNPANSLVPLWMIAHICGESKKKKKITKTESQPKMQSLAQDPYPSDSFLNQRVYKNPSPIQDPHHFNSRERSKKSPVFDQEPYYHDNRDLPANQLAVMLAMPKDDGIAHMWNITRARRVEVDCDRLNIQASLTTYYYVSNDEGTRVSKCLEVPVNERIDEEMPMPENEKNKIKLRVELQRKSGLPKQVLWCPFLSAEVFDRDDFLERLIPFEYRGETYVTVSDDYNWEVSSYIHSSDVFKARRMNDPYRTQYTSSRPNYESERPKINRGFESTRAPSHSEAQYGGGYSSDQQRYQEDYQDNFAPSYDQRHSGYQEEYYNQGSQRDYPSSSMDRRPNPSQRRSPLVSDPQFSSRHRENYEESSGYDQQPPRYPTPPQQGTTRNRFGFPDRESHQNGSFHSSAQGSSTVTESTTSLLSNASRSTLCDYEIGSSQWAFFLLQRLMSHEEMQTCLMNKDHVAFLEYFKFLNSNQKS